MLLRLNNILKIGAMLFCAVYCAAQAAEGDSLRSRTIIVAADFAGLPFYFGSAALDVDVLFGEWFGARAGIGTGYAAYTGTASGYSFAVKLLSPRRLWSAARFEINLGASRLRVTPDGGGAADWKWFPVATVGTLYELTGRDEPVCIVARAGVGYCYYYGAPLYLGWGVAF